MVENGTRIKNGIKVSVSVSVKIQKNIMRAKIIKFRIQPPAVVKMVNMSEALSTI